MSDSTTKQPAIRRAHTPGSLLKENDLPPGGIFVNGSFRPGGSGALIDIVDPSSELTIAQVAEGPAEDTDGAVAASKNAWETTTADMGAPIAMMTKAEMGRVSINSSG